MPTPQEFIKSLQQDGVLLVKGGELYFIPVATLNACKMPEPFQNKFDGVSDEYFVKTGGPGPAEQQSIVYRGMNRALSEAFVADGISQAVWIETDKDVRPLVTLTGQSQQPMFRYDPNETKIVVDMSRGGRPSDR